tara:strand:+ start:19 stop:588 length:570 start_codon:yes stop_codon:yes gene_type:complete
MKKNIFFIIVLSFLTSQNNCLENLISKSINPVKSNVTGIKFDMKISLDNHNIYNEYINNYLFLNEFDRKIRIDYNNQTILIDSSQSINIFHNTNQLFIEQPDTILLNKVFRLIENLNYKKLNNSKIDSIFYFNNNKVKFSFQDSCYLDFLEIEHNDGKVNIYNILIENYNNGDMFMISKENYFNFDLRK